MAQNIDIDKATAVEEKYDGNRTEARTKYFNKSKRPGL